MPKIVSRANENTWSIRRQVSREVKKKIVEKFDISRRVSRKYSTGYIRKIFHTFYYLFSALLDLPVDDEGNQIEIKFTIMVQNGGFKLKATLEYGG